MNISSVKSCALRILGDPAGSRYADEELEGAARLALEEYSRADPCIQVETLSCPNGGECLNLSGLTQPPLFIISIYPQEAEPTSGLCRTLAFQFEAGADGLVARFTGGSLAAGTRLRVCYAAAHCLAGLDGATEGTVQPGRLWLLAGGTACAALDARIRARVEDLGPRAGESSRMQELSDRLRRAFDEGLRKLRTAQLWGGFPARSEEEP